jgi:hypothetical protein
MQYDHLEFLLVADSGNDCLQMADVKTGYVAITLLGGSASGDPAAPQCLHGRSSTMHGRAIIL